MFGFFMPPRTIKLVVSASEADYVIAIKAGSPKNPVIVDLTINSGVVVTRMTTGNYLKSVHPASLIKITNNGHIAGNGGSGASAVCYPAAACATALNGSNGGSGQDALSIEASVVIDNQNGYIFGGGGGGGAGGGARDTNTALGTVGSGGGGGRGVDTSGAGTGAPCNSLAGGITGTTGGFSGAGGGGASVVAAYGTGGAGGNGGDWGAAGGNGGNASLGTCSNGIGGTGGAAGRAAHITSSLVYGTLGSLRFLSGNDSAHVKGAIA